MSRLRLEPSNQPLTGRKAYGIMSRYSQPVLSDSIIRDWNAPEMPKRTYQPKIRRRVRVHGFRARMATADGRKVIKARRLKGRVRLSVTSNNDGKKVNWNAAKSPVGRPTAKK